MSVALLTIGDGRDEYHARSLASAGEMLPMDLFTEAVHVSDPDHELGFAGAIRRGWEQIRADWIFHLELDFTFNAPVPLRSMITVLDQHPHLVQMALLRQPWNEQEREAGGIVQMRPDTYTQRAWAQWSWLEHRNNVTTNPCIWPRRIIERGWPQCPQSEGHFGIDLFASDPTLRAAYWGDGQSWVHHIGDVRSGKGY